jgi:hypothetical protein
MSERSSTSVSPQAPDQVDSPAGEGYGPSPVSRPDHVLIVHFEDGEDEWVSLRCNLTGPDRPCAVIDCPVDHEDVSRECIKEHGAEARDECWAVEWHEAGGREALNTEALEPVEIPVRVFYDAGGVAVENA